MIYCKKYMKEQSNMKCKICGGEVSEGTAVCPICGFSLTDDPASSKTGSSSDMTGKSSSDTPKNKYQLVGGNSESFNPFGADPKNVAARTAPVMMDPQQESSAYDPGGSGPSAYFQPQPGASPYGSPGGPYNPYDQPPMPAGPVPQLRSVNPNKSVIIIISAVCVLLFFIFFALFRGKKTPAEGTYAFSYATANGISVSKAELQASGTDVEGFTLEVNGKHGKFSFMGRTASCDVKVDGSKISFVSGGDSLDGTFDVDSGTITLEMNGAYLVFTRQ